MFKACICCYGFDIVFINWLILSGLEFLDKVKWPKGVILTLFFLSSFLLPLLRLTSGMLNDTFLDCLAISRVEKMSSTYFSSIICLGCFRYKCDLYFLVSVAYDKLFDRLSSTFISGNLLWFKFNVRRFRSPTLLFAWYKVLKPSYLYLPFLTLVYWSPQAPFFYLASVLSILFNELLFDLKSSSWGIC